MNIVLPLMILLSVTVGMPNQKEKPILSKLPLTEEEVQIYGTYLDSYHSDVKGNVSISDRTVPLYVGYDEQDACIQGLHLSGSEPASKTIHLLPVELVKGRSLQLVDAQKHKFKDPDDEIRHGQSVKDAVTEGFEAGLLRLSEIAFDPNHTLAVFKVSFYCGSLCGYGGTILFEKKSDKWVQSQRSCNFWES